MKDGQISESGTYKELLDKKGDFADFLILHMQEQSVDKVDENGKKYALINNISLLQKVLIFNIFRNW